MHEKLSPIERASHPLKEERSIGPGCERIYQSQSAPVTDYNQTHWPACT